MADEATLRRISKRHDQVLEIQWSELPEPPETLKRIPGVDQWWQQMRLVRNRDIETLNKLVVNLQIASSTP
jgi:hypothetical protein